MQIRGGGVYLLYYMYGMPRMTLCRVYLSIERLSLSNMSVSVGIPFVSKCPFIKYLDSTYVFQCTMVFSSLPKFSLKKAHKNGFNVYCRYIYSQ